MAIAVTTFIPDRSWDIVRLAAALRSLAFARDFGSGFPVTAARLTHASSGISVSPEAP
jgi:hypothetical protein